MLFRSDSDIALSAGFSEPPRIVDMPVAASPAPQPSAEALELQGVKAENEALRAELEQLKQQWSSALVDARTRAEAEAARKHKDDDARRLRALEGALREASANYAESLDGQAATLATSLACEALSCLVEPQAGEVEWLARIITQRLTRTRQASSPRIHVAPADLGALTVLLPQDCGIVADEQVPPGAARIRLTLGEIVIDPAQGLDRVLDALRNEPLDG